MKKLFVLASLAVASAALATDIKLVGLGNGYTGVPVSGVANENVFAGELKFQSTDLGSFTSYCGDLLNSISIGQTFSVNVVDVSTLSQGYQDAANIFGNNYAGVTNNEQAAGLQLAIWEAIYDDGSTPNFTSGNFKASVNSSVLADAAAYYGSKNTATSGVKFLAPIGAGQGQFIAVPEPFTVAGLAIGLIALRKRNKKA